MAMAALDEQQPMTTLEELKLWREATTIFMLAGHGGCGPHGLALAAWHRGFHASAYISKEGALFKDTVRNDDKSGFWSWCTKAFSTTSARPASNSITTRSPWMAWAALHDGRVPVILISTWQLESQPRAPLGDGVCDG